MEKLNKQIQAQLNVMAETGKLFRSSVTGQEVWETYIKSFEAKHNPIFRDPNSTLHNCNLCNNFIRRYGNIVSVDANGDIITLWDIDAPEEYVTVVKKLTSLLKSKPIGDVFFETFDELKNLPYESCKKNQALYKLGIDKNIKRYTKEEAALYGVVKEGEIRTFNHLHMFMPGEFVDQSGKSVESIMGSFRDSKNVLKRALDEIPLDTLELVRDLINQDSLLDGKAHLTKLLTMISIKSEYDKVEPSKRDNWCWTASYKNQFAKFKNELIGTLCSDLAEGMELNKACQTWNVRVDPVNFMKAKAPITKSQIESAKKFVTDNGYEESFDRRCATLDDIKASDILHLNSGKCEVKSVSVFDKVKTTSTRHKKSEFDGIDEVSIDTFMKDILPTCTSVEAFLSSKHEKNLVTLTTANVPDSKRIFKWDNNYSWTYNGNLAGKSEIKEIVKDAGGNVNGALMARLVWNDDKQHDRSDLDLWCSQPDMVRIGYNTGYRKDSGNRFTSMSGQLDLDDRAFTENVHAENIYFLDKSLMKKGVYKFWVHQFSASNSKGFKFEIEFDGEIYRYEMNSAVAQNRNVEVATVELLSDGTFNINHIMQPVDSTFANKEIYGLDTNQFHKVNLLCLSPNHWGENNVGNKHYFFMLDGCKTNLQIRTFHNENLKSELLEFRKVMEVLGSVNMIEPSEKQLSGIGFNATVRDELVVRLQGSFKRVIKIKF